MLDRVIAKVGGKEWWANLSGRAKAQQMWTAHRGGAKVVSSLLMPVHSWVAVDFGFLFACLIIAAYLTELHIVSVVVVSYRCTFFSMFI